MRARTGLWEPWVGNGPGPPGRRGGASEPVLAVLGGKGVGGCLEFGLSGAQIEQEETEGTEKKS